MYKKEQTMSEELKNNNQQPEENLSEQRQIRREKLQALREAGRDPFLNETWDVNAHSVQIKDNFEEMDGKEGILVASKIADRVGITRSVIVNALRKFESAGVIESRSSGMKGTYIKVLNDVVFDELEELKKQSKKKN